MVDSPNYGQLKDHDVSKWYIDSTNHSQLKDNATDAPHVTTLIPAELKDNLETRILKEADISKASNLRGAIMSCLNDGGVMFVVKSGASKVDEPNLGIF